MNSEKWLPAVTESYRFGSHFGSQQKIDPIRKAKVAAVPSPESLLVDLKRASAILGLSLWTVRDLVCSKTIPGHHIGRKIFIKTSDLRDSLDPILEEMEAKKDGKLFHSFRRFRSEVLRKNRVPWQLEKQWLGHASRDISNRYAEGLSDDLQWRKQVAQQTGLGFSIPLGQPGQLSVEENLFANVA
ncbi:MAG: hypothetical protein QOJ41_878 [Acidobacteriaceae bacterium]|nr:hypothetical protein [Acidobacteriaceae bacterium]